MMMKVFLLSALICTIPFFIGASEEQDDITEIPADFSEESLFTDNEEEEENGLFSEESLVTKQEEDTEPVNPENALLVSERVELGGEFGFNYTTAWLWDDPASVLEQKPEWNFGLGLYSDLYFDARPEEDFRVFGKGRIIFPFSEDENRSFDDIVIIEELFSDFDLEDTLFFRVGKQELNWGVGYYFKPANIVNPETNLPEPVAVKSQLPLGVNTLYLYTFIHTIDEVGTPAVAPKAEILLGTTEFHLGGYYQRGHAPAIMITVTKDAADFHFFGEGKVSYGADKNFIEETAPTPDNPLGIGVTEKDDRLFFSGTAGFHYTYGDETSNVNLSANGQYYFNGYGYNDSSVISDNRNKLAYLLGNGSIIQSDLTRPGKHYIAAGFSWNDIMGSNLGLRTSWISNLNDLSGTIDASLTLRDLYDWINISLGINYAYGDAGEEFTPGGDGIKLKFNTSLGNGKF
jgi:hypothetical protein